MSTPLSALLSRVRAQIAREATTTLKTAEADAARAVSEDYAQRLAERAKFRRLLADEAQDGLRFRWYFQHIENGQDLDQLRAWIDAKMAKEKQNVA